METVKASVVLDDVFRLIGWDADQLDERDWRDARACLSQALQTIWEAWWWQLLMVTERMQFAPSLPAPRENPQWQNLVPAGAVYGERYDYTAYVLPIETGVTYLLVPGANDMGPYDTIDSVFYTPGEGDPHVWIAPQGVRRGMPVTMQIYPAAGLVNLVPAGASYSGNPASYSLAGLTAGQTYLLVPGVNERGPYAGGSAGGLPSFFTATGSETITAKDPEADGQAVTAQVFLVQRMLTLYEPGVMYYEPSTDWYYMLLPGAPDRSAPPLVDGQTNVAGGWARWEELRRAPRWAAQAYAVGSQVSWSGQVWQWCDVTGQGQAASGTDVPGSAAGWLAVPEWWPMVPWTDLDGSLVGPAGKVRSVSIEDPRTTAGPGLLHFEPLEEGTRVIGLTVARAWVRVRRPAPVLEGDKFDPAASYEAAAPGERSGILAAE